MPQHDAGVGGAALGQQDDRLGDVLRAVDGLAWGAGQAAAVADQGDVWRQYFHQRLEVSAEAGF